MPKEERRILFASHEVSKALVTYCQRAGKFLPAGVVSRVAIHEKGEAPVVLHFSEWPGDPDRDKRPFSAVEVAAALITYCRDLRIPIPKAASKTFVPENGGLTLVLYLDDSGR